MRHIRLLAAAVFLLTMLTGSAFADSNVTMQLTGVGGNNGGGVYTYPYDFTVNGTPTSLICDTFDNEVYVGETWTATVSDLLSGAGLFGVNTQKYEAAGLIFKSILSGTVDATEGNWAIWGLFSTNAQDNSYYASSGAAGLASQYLTLALSAAPGDFAGLVLYTPVAGSQSVGGTPQEYIGVSMPEPGTIAMLLLTLAFGAGIFVFRKRLGLNLVTNA
jgi:PEP-CTERM motif